MDQQELVNTLMTALTPVLVASGKQAVDHVIDRFPAGVKEAWSVVRRHLSRDNYAQQTLERWKEEPDSDRRRRQMAEVLHELAERDPSMFDELAPILSRPDIPPQSRFSIKVSDNAQVGSMLNNSGTIGQVNVASPNFADVVAAPAFPDPPIDYQIDALRQVLRHLWRSKVTTFQAKNLDSLVSNLGVRDSFNSIFEPLTLTSVQAGLQRLIDDGDVVVCANGYLEIVGERIPPSRFRVT